MRLRLLDFREGRDHRLAIVLQELLAGPFLQIELAERRSALEYRLGQGRRDGVKGGARTEQRGESQVLETALRGELNGGEEGGACGRHIGVGTRELGFRLPYVRSPHEQLRRQPGRHPRYPEPIHAAAAYVDVLRHAARAARFCSTCCTNGGIEARVMATRLACWATSSAEAVPLSKRSWISFRIPSDAFRFLRAVSRRSCVRALENKCWRRSPGW